MTIAQQFLGKKINKQQQEPLVPNEKTPNVKDVEEGKPVVVTMHTHVRRVSSMTTACVFITALLVCTTGIIGGVYLYKQFSQYKLRHFHGHCSIPYNSDKFNVAKAEAFQGSALESAALTGTEEVVNKPTGSFFDEKFDLDLKTEAYEKIEVPAFSHGRRAQFIHDFVVNRTAIADYENRRCFVMFLNQQFVLSPRMLFNIISRMRDGLFDADTGVIRQYMQVVIPHAHSFKNVGPVIAKDCNSMNMFELERVSSPVVKRSLDDESKDLFVEFAGNKITEYKIVNLQDAVPGGVHS